MNKKKKQNTKNKGRIQVTVQREDRLNTIHILALALNNLTAALNQETVVEVSHCNISNTDLGVNIDTAEEVTRTEIKEIGE